MTTLLDWGFVLKKTLALTILVDPFLTAPLFVLATAGMSLRARVRFARVLSVAVAVGLLGGGLLGLHVLSLMGVTLASIQLVGGVITFGVPLAMVVAKEDAVKGVDARGSSAVQASLVPLAMPFLVGPAALAYVMATSQMARHRSGPHRGVAVDRGAGHLGGAGSGRAHRAALLTAGPGTDGATHGLPAGGHRGGDDGRWSAGHVSGGVGRGACGGVKLRT